MITDAPQFVGWIITNKCNFSCPHCYALSLFRERHRYQELAKDEIEVACENIIKSKVMTVYISGGEPLMSEHCEYIIERLASKGIRVSISSNGSLLNLERLRVLKKIGLAMAVISIDHSDPEIHNQTRRFPNSFELAVTALQNCRELGIRSYISTIITRKNWTALENIYELGVQNKVKGINFKKVRLVGDLTGSSGDYVPEAQEERLIMETIGRLKQDNQIEVRLYYNSSPALGIDEGCPCGRNIITIKPDGSIVPCVYATSVIGNVLVDNLRSLWVNNEILQDLRSHHRCVLEM